MNTKVFEQRAGTAKGCSAAPFSSAVADSEAAVDSALQDADQLPPRPGPDLDSWDLGSLCPNSLVWCYCRLFLSDYCYWVIRDLGWICIHKSWVTSIVTCVNSLLFLGASVAWRAGGGISSLVLPVPEKGWGLAYRKEYSPDTCKVRISLATWTLSPKVPWWFLLKCILR